MGEKDRGSRIRLALYSQEQSLWPVFCLGTIYSVMTDVLLFCTPCLIYIVLILT